MTVARELLGCTIRLGECAGRIVEVEAYLGLDDRAAHASRGVTPRTRIIFGPPGFAYVYLIYGMYDCLNLIAEPEGSPGCVLIRALEPVSGIERMQERRGGGEVPVRQLLRGPGRLTIGMGICRQEHLGCDVTRGPLVVEAGDGALGEKEIGVSPRVGIRHCADWPLRFFVRNSPFVSGVRIL